MVDKSPKRIARLIAIVSIFSFFIICGIVVNEDYINTSVFCGIAGFAVLIYDKEMRALMLHLITTSVRSLFRLSRSDIE